MGNQATSAWLKPSPCLIYILVLIYVVVKTTHWCSVPSQRKHCSFACGQEDLAAAAQHRGEVFKIHSLYVMARLSQMSFLRGCRQTKPQEIIACSWLDVLWTQLPDQKATFTRSCTSAGVENYSSSTEELCLEIYQSVLLFHLFFPSSKDYLHFSLYAINS